MDDVFSPQSARTLSGYRLMWLVAMFDLPTRTDAERKAYVRFRNYLLDEGFEMAQYSVYMRCCAGKEKVEALVRRIGANLPPSGTVTLFAITDKQYEGMINFRCRARHPSPAKPAQLVLF